jgi:hypothetical protein
MRIPDFGIHGFTASDNTPAVTGNVTVMDGKNLMEEGMHVCMCIVYRVVSLHVLHVCMLVHSYGQRNGYRW